MTLTGQDGHTHHCKTNSTSCQLPGIHCGETYGITVTPYSETCAGHPSAVYMFRAGEERLETRYPYSTCREKNILIFQLRVRTLKPFFSPSVQVSALPATSLYLQCARTALSLGLKYQGLRCSSQKQLQMMATLTLAAQIIPTHAISLTSIVVKPTLLLL